MEYYRCAKGKRRGRKREEEEEIKGDKRKEKVKRGSKESKVVFGVWVLTLRIDEVLLGEGLRG